MMRAKKRRFLCHTCMGKRDVWWQRDVRRHSCFLEDNRVHVHVSHQGKCEEKSWSFSIHFCLKYTNLSLRHAMQLWCLSLHVSSTKKSSVVFSSSLYPSLSFSLIFFNHSPLVFLPWVNSEN